MKNVQIVELIVVAIIAIVGITILGNIHNNALAKAMDTYTDCMAQTYHTSPQEWYAQHRELPECDLSK